MAYTHSVFWPGLPGRMVRPTTESPAPPGEQRERQHRPNRNELEREDVAVGRLEEIEWAAQLFDCLKKAGQCGQGKRDHCNWGEALEKHSRLRAPPATGPSDGGKSQDPACPEARACQVYRVNRDCWCRGS